MRRIAIGFGFGPADVDDLTQDVAMTLVQTARVPADEPGLRRWLTRVTVNRCLLEFRRRKRFAGALAEAAGAAAGAPGDAGAPGHFAAEDAARVRTALAQLPADLLAPLVLRYYAEHTAVEIAAALELSHDVVRDRLRRARLWLADALRDREGE